MKVSTCRAMLAGSLCLFTLISGNLAAQKIGAVTVEENNKAVERVLAGHDSFEDDSWNPFKNGGRSSSRRACRQNERTSTRSSSARSSSCSAKRSSCSAKRSSCSAKKSSCGSKVIRRCYGGVCVKVK